MAGQPKRKQDLILLDQVGEDRVREMLEEGKPIARICIELKVGKKALHDWLEAPERAALLTRARTRAADLLAAETLEIADTVGEQPGEIAKAKLRTDVRRWLAGKWDPSRYGEQRGVQVQVNVGDMHLTAVRSRVVDVTPSTERDTDAPGDAG